jgi:ferric-dicitrate binding protein FerR (iron transport regulator)
MSDGVNRNGSDDRIGELIRAAGPRPAVPEERAARVRATVLDHWQSEVDSRRRVRQAATWGSLAAALVAGVWLASSLWLGSGGSGTNALPSLRVATVQNAVWMRAVASPASETTALRPGDSVPLDSELSTDAGGRAAFTTASGHSLRLDVDTRVRVLSDSTIALDLGAVYIDSGGVAREPLQIETVSGTVRDVGTQFEVRLAEATMTVRVREGKATIDREHAPLEVSAGWELSIDAEGRTERRALRPDGPEWDWLASVTPTIEIDGSTLQDFLYWATRERGLRVSYSDAELAASASRIVLEGSIEGMTVEQALDAVLPTCAVVYEIRDGVLRIDRMP